MTHAVLQGVLYGHGHMGRLHATKLRARPDVELKVIDPALGMYAPESNNPDFAIIATPTQLHAQIASPLLNAGVPCLVEKPLASSMTDAARLAAHAHLCVGHIERFNPVFSLISECKPEFIEVERLAPFSDRSMDIDVIADLMIHDLDLLLRYMPGEIVDVRAKGIGVISNRPDIVQARIEVLLQNGRIGVASISASRVSTTAARRWRLIESGQYWSLDLLTRTVKKVDWASGALTPTTVAVPDSDPLQAEHDAFLHTVRGEQSFPCTGSDALAAMTLAERVRSCLR
ncbi:MAG: Gfo/Idh/MocA family protein [Myxococcota bacterium]